MEKGKFNLRDWQYTRKNGEFQSSMLGMSWNWKYDKLYLNLHWLEQFQLNDITKRNILSITHMVFDPIVRAYLALLFPKLLLQKIVEKEYLYIQKLMMK